MSSLIELKNVSKTFHLESGLDLKVLAGVNLNIPNDDFVALLGPSGSGKSTCLRIMGGLIRPSSGSVLVNSKPLEGINSQVSMVFQSYALFPWETVQKNIDLALESKMLPLKERREKVRLYIDMVGMEGFENAYPRELSGGMKQRVGLARALVMERPLLFLDEPFSALDVLTASTLRDEVVKIYLERKTQISSIVLVTHNIQEAVLMADRILILGTHPGHIRYEIKNSLPYPRDEDSPEFQEVVKKIHALITETMIPDTPMGQIPQPSTQAPATRGPLLEALPRAQITEVIGLLETLAEGPSGTNNIFEISQEIRKDFGSTLYLVKAAELLNLAITPGQEVKLTNLGERFVKGDINLRKNMLHDLFGKLRIAQATVNLLKKRENGRITIVELNESISEWFPNENPHELVETLISWGRFAEYFGYSDDSKEVYLIS